MSWKIVWNDNDYWKVLRVESYTEDDAFVIAIDTRGNEIKIGKRYIVSIEKNVDD